jgi:enoyl-[acyl-carrier protein] reductase I
MIDLKGKTGVILGVANERSIAWAIAEAAHAAGARLAFNYQNERLEKTVSEMAARLEGTIAAPCDLSHEDEVDTFFDKVGAAFGGKLDFLIHSVAFAKKDELSGRFIDSSREGFELAMNISVFTLVAAAKRAEPLMNAAGGGSIITLTYYGAEKVIKNYNTMGVAKAALEASVRYLASDLGPEAIRVNAISAGPIKTLAARGISGFSDILNVVSEKAPLRRNVEAREVGGTAVFLCSDAGKGITGEVLYVDCGYNIMGL